MIDTEIGYMVRGDRNHQLHQQEINHYPDGIPVMRRHSAANQPFLQAMDGPIEAILLRPTGLSSFMTALFWVDAMAERGMRVPPLVLPSLPGARQDRINAEGDFLFTAKSIAREINVRRFPAVITLDPHSDVMPALINRCHVVHTDELFARLSYEHFMPKYTGVIAPDGGAEKRAGKVAKMLKVPLLRAWKTRDVATGKISGFGVEPLDKDGSYLLVDDICDGGGTFIGLADAILGDTPGIVRPNLDLYVSHGIFSKGMDELNQRFRSIYTTDSIIHQPTGVTVLAACQELLRRVPTS